MPSIAEREFNTGAASERYLKTIDAYKQSLIKHRELVRKALPDQIKRVLVELNAHVRGGDI